MAARDASIQGVADPAIWDSSARGRASTRRRCGGGFTSRRGTTAGFRAGCSCTTGWPLTRRGTRSCMCSRTVGHSFGRSQGCCSPRRTPEDLDTRQEDHVADESRYFCMSRPIAPPRRGGGEKPADDPLNQRAALGGSWAGPGAQHSVRLRRRKTEEICTMCGNLLKNRKRSGDKRRRGRYNNRHNLCGAVGTPRENSNERKEQV